MLKYVAAAVALRCFSATPLTRGVYRRLGNTVGNRRRSSGQLPPYYLDRITRMLRLAEEHRLVKDGDRVLELGTGWFHWEALTLRLFFDIEGVLFDVWDNRQLGGLKNYVRQLRPFLSTSLKLSPSQLQRAQSLINQIDTVPTFADLYRLLGFKYVIESSGSLQQFDDASFDLVVSAGVLEHVHVDAVPGLFIETNRLLKDGGWALHSIDTSDHLSHYDSSASRKQYLACSEKAWKRFFENDVQYINRLQRNDWLRVFRSAGFELVDEEAHRIDVSGLKLAQRFAGKEEGDLSCTVLRAALRKTTNSRQC